MSARPKPVDPVELRVRLSAAAEDVSDLSELRRRARPILQDALDRGRAVAEARLNAGAEGVEVARLYSAAADVVVQALWDYTTVHAARARVPTEGERLSLLATGGYGRGVMAPFSDIDLLFLRKWKETPHSESVIEFMLYALWDLGLKVGHASRTIDECVKLAKADHTIRTALLEARLLAGDEALAQKLRTRFVAEAVKGHEKAFVAAKLAERDARHAKAGASRYLVEPNVKEGKGGLRDLNTLLWIARFLKPEDPTGWAALDGLLTRKERREFERAFDFLWRVRCRLHLVAGRAEEKLTFDRQAEVARLMGYEARAEHSAVERFMRRYFLMAREVGGLTRAFCAKLEADRTAERVGLTRFLPLPPRRRKLDVPGFVEQGGRLALADAQVFAKDPVNLLRLFRTADRFDLDLHPDAFAAVSRHLDLVTPALRRDPEAARAFLDVLAHGSQPYRVLSLMADAGLLGRFLPEFGRVVGQTQFNMYHAYTVDEHTLRAVGIIDDIEHGRLEGDHPLATQIMPLIGDKETLYLGMLLHDTGKGGAGGQEKDGETAARRACERLGLPRWKCEQVAWLARHHLVLSDFAQKRDVSDPATVARFAEIVGDPERLRLLLVLTVADVRAVGPGVWNGWKGRLMRELYAATEAVFRGGRDADPATSFRRAQAERADEARQVLREADPRFAAWTEAMDDAYFAGFSPEEQVVHAALAQRAESVGAAAKALVRPDRNATELIVAARDRAGLFADLAETLSALGAGVIGAQVFTSGAGQALDVFFVQELDGKPFGDGAPAALDRAARALERAALGEPRRMAVGKTPLPARMAAFSVTPRVVVDDQASERALVVEVTGRDRPRLLADLARALSAAGLSIESAHVQSVGEQAVDVFYVVDADTGEKRLPEARLEALRGRLRDILDPAGVR